MTMVSLISRCTLLSLIACSLVFSSSALCEESDLVNVFVRTIQASEPVEGEPDSESSAQAPKLPVELSDIAAKLTQLPFSSFTLLASKNATHAIKRRETMQLPNGQSLTLRPIYMDNQRVGLWLSWREADGSEILNTRVHFDADDSVVTGTDCAGNKGLILAIKAVPAAATTGEVKAE